MLEIKVLVPDERVAEFYQFFGAWLAGATPPNAGEGHADSGPLLPWGSGEDDLALAQVVWNKLSEFARAMFSVLMDEPGRRVAGEVLANDLGIPNGKYGVAGVLAWPGRHCKAVGRTLPTEYEEGPDGESGIYWMNPDVAALFVAARDAE